MLGPLGLLVLDAAELETGDRALDVGCSTGATTLEAARRVSPLGMAVGSDISAPMIETARRRAAESGLANVAFIQGDARTQRFHALRFDALVSRFGMMLCDDSEAAFRNLGAALRPRARVAFVTGREAERNAWFTVCMAAVAEHVVFPGDREVEPRAFSLADPAFIGSLLERTGYVEVVIDAVEDDVWLASDLDDAITFFDEAYGDPLRLVSDEATVAGVAATLRERLAPFVSDEGVRVPASAWLVTARRA